MRRRERVKMKDRALTDPKINPVINLSPPRGIKWLYGIKAV